jgi:general secretion pathway protein H
MTLGGARLTGTEAEEQAGFTLLEVVCVLAIVASLAALAMPAMPFGTSRQRLQAYALETAALLKADRSAAMRRQTAVSSRVDAGGRSIRSGADGRVVRMPKDVAMRAILPQRCSDRLAAQEIRFLPSGMSCGGTLRLARQGTGYEVRVNWLTGGVDVVAANG